MKKLILIIISSLLILALVACTRTVAAGELKSSLQREIPAVASQDLQKLVEGNSTFALKMYQMLSQKDGNFFYSPYSISEVLAMTYGGARRTTEEQMAKALVFLLAQEKLHPAFNALDQELAKRGEGAKGKDGKGFRLNVVNAIWGQKDFPFLSSYLDLLAKNYGAGLRVVDFIKASEESRQTINRWVSEKTEEKIKELLPKGSIDETTRLVLTNAIYFNAAWLCPFEKEATADDVFKLLDGSTVNVPFMNQQKSFNYASGQDYQAIELPYDGRELSMVIILPNSDKFADFENSLNYGKLNEIMQNLKRAEVKLSMPKFKIESEFSLKDALAKLGMPVAFTDQADFSGMDGKRDLMISDVVHKAFISVDEAGTEAAAATGVIVGVTSAPTEIVNLKIDHPFIFLIRDIPTGTIIFNGRVMNPVN